MDKSEYLRIAAAWPKDCVKLNRIYSLYSTNLPDLLERILSNCDDTTFFDDGSRILSYAEVVDAEQDLHIQFKDAGLLPLADCGENDFIVYCFNDGFWALFNIIDKVLFKQRGELEELLR